MKLCMFCKHLWFDGGFPGVSDETPHECMKLRCRLLPDDCKETRKFYKWELEYGSDIEDFRRVMKTAETCMDYAEDK